MTENKGENKLDELLKERYELAKGRLSEICTETVVEEKFLDFFHKEAAFLLKTGTILESDQKDFSMENCRAKIAVSMKNSFQKITDTAMEIQPMQQKNLENMGKPFLFFIQN